MTWIKQLLIKLLDKLTGNRLVEAEKLKDNELRRSLLLLQSHVEFTQWIEDDLKKELVDILILNNEVLHEFLDKKNILHKTLLEKLEPSIEAFMEDVKHKNSYFLQKIASPFTYEIKDFLENTSN